ncbi:MAG: zinc ribbon domain-containing protein [Abditibacteriales bacterium]|nr:zinc ribbon domain-containing protein [Abditibacteriales bacterium]MDW8365225.1 zinc ribbon domain-containing protein [Abditibacteriales bacterium]
MLIIFGARGKGKVLREELRPCRVCQRNTLHVIAETSQWFTLFFIPIFPFSRRHIRQCAVCGYTERLTREEAMSASALPPLRTDVCARCGAKIAPEAIERGDPYCVLCGHPLPQKPKSINFCPYCGAPIPPEALTRGDKFCMNCGQPLPKGTG